MLFDKETAKRLEVLVHPTVETAIILLLEHVLKEKEQLFENPEASDAQLRQFQGQKTLISELKQYRLRLKDSVIREKERELDDDN